LFLLITAYSFWADAYILSIIRDTLIFGLLALSLDYLWGKGGLISFGHATFFGIGAYSIAICTLNLETPLASMLGLFTAIIVPGIVAILFGYFLIFAGVRGAYFVVVTLALSLIAQQAVISWVKVTGGDTGLLGIPALTFVFFDFRYEFIEGMPQYFLIVSIIVFILVGLWLICRGQYGKILAAIQDNENRALSLGYNTSLHLLVIFVISAMIAGLAGGLYATSTGFVAPDMLGLLLSTEVFVWVAIGGRGSLLGPIIGAFVVIRLEQFVSSINTSLWPLIVGVFFIGTVFLIPDGIFPIFRNITNRTIRLIEERQKNV
jgi:branched-chain amino acid transport system permease protein